MPAIPRPHHVGSQVTDLARVYMIDPDGIRFEPIQTSRSLGQLSQGEASAASWPAAG